MNVYRKCDAIYTYNETLFSLEKKGNPVICYNMDEPSGHVISRINQSQKEEPIMIPLKCGI